MSSSMRSPRKTSHVRPVTGHATWMSHSGSSASSEVRLNAKRVNSMPAQRNTIANPRMASEPSSRNPAATFGDSTGNRSTSKCVPSRTPTIAPIMIIQMNRNRAISSVQM